MLAFRPGVSAAGEVKMMQQTANSQFALAMVVDDDPITCELGCAVLRSLGVTSILRATSGADALAKLAAIMKKIVNTPSTISLR